ncbi:uncharacterized protein LOC128832731 [Malaclemys terrapin pileata]|uniref:uncharacterized protein LOC128832731 n=1 Tax=Malaclemys terrapin pileata TaxID=2991368 RepID=UPI0023A7E67C|nr:uncharacterized protein LOC128832731 [Malaclemys terrapin pileata]
MLASMPRLWEKGYTRDTQQCHVKIKELRQVYQKTREAKSRSGSAPQTCCFYEELHAILGGDPITTPKRSVYTSQELRATSSNDEEDIVDEREEEEEHVRQASGESILPNSQELFLTLKPITSQDQLASEHDAGEGTSAETLSVGASSTLGQKLSQIRRWKKKTREDMFNELRSDKTELRAWRITLSENLDIGRTGEHEWNRSMPCRKRCHGL